MAYEPRIEKNLNGDAFTDELHPKTGAGVGASAFGLDHDYFLSGTDIAINVATGGGGYQLVLNTDYVEEEENTELEAEILAELSLTKTVHKKIRVTNATYQTGNLYFTGKYIADDNEYADVETRARFSNDLSITSDYTILSTEVYQNYRVTNGSVLRIIDLPTTATAEDQKFRVIKMDTAARCVRITPNGSEKIVSASGARLDHVFLFKQGDTVELMSDGTDWFITNNFRPYFDSGLINRTDFTNVHQGAMQIPYSGASGTFEIGEIITQTAPANTWIVINDTGSVLTCANATGTGVATNAQGLTGNYSGVTATVSSTTLNADTAFLHNWGVSTNHISIRYNINGSASFTGSRQPASGFADGAIGGFNTIEIDANSFQIQTEFTGYYEVQDSGSLQKVDTDNYYYNISIRLE